MWPSARANETRFRSPGGLGTPEKMDDEYYAEWVTEVAKMMRANAAAAPAVEVLPVDGDPIKPVDPPA